MTALTEADVEQAALDWLSALGWQAAQGQDIAPDAPNAERADYGQVVLDSRLWDALVELNPDLPSSALEDAHRKLTRPEGPTLEARNRAFHRMLVDGVTVEYRAEDGSIRGEQVKVVDFDDPGANVLHVTWEWRLKPPARKGNRSDAMSVVNGVPVAIVEHKNPTDADAIDRGITQLRRYEFETPELMGAAQLFNVTHLLDYWYGVTWNLSRRYMARWKETQEESYRFAVQSFFEPTDFLRTLRDWILFYVEDGETRKTVLRQHQRRAVDRIVERCSEPVKRRGLVWHTQGSGKTFTLLTAAAWSWKPGTSSATPRWLSLWTAPN